MLAILASALLAEAAVLVAPEEGPQFDAGFLFRVREALTENAPGLPGAGGRTPLGDDYKSESHVFRFDTYPWMGVNWGNYGFNFGLAHCTYEYITGTRAKRQDRAYAWPDLVTLHRLYFEGRDLFDGQLFWRVGRQPMANGAKSLFGLDRILVDGTPGDSSITEFSDMARVAWTFENGAKLDAFALYNSAKNFASFGKNTARDRSLNRFTSSDSTDMDQWGGGLIWSDKAYGMPYKLYTIFKQDEEYEAKKVTYPRKSLVTMGGEVRPQLTETFGLDLEAAQQVGKRGNGRPAGGTMAYGGVCWHEQSWAGPGKPFADSGLLYMSGAKNRLGEDDADMAWDPLWGRTTMYGNILSSNGNPAYRYWTNMLYYRSNFGLNFGYHHKLDAVIGPIWAPVKDGLGGGSGNFKGFFSRLTYRFPLLVPKKNASGLGRFDVWMVWTVEMLNPGDYYATRRPAYYFRWLLNVKF